MYGLIIVLKNKHIKAYILYMYTCVCGCKVLCIIYMYNGLHNTDSFTAYISTHLGNIKHLKCKDINCFSFMVIAIAVIFLLLCT